MSMIFDAHAHYDDKAFDQDRDSVLQAMPSNGVGKIVNAAVDIETSKIGIKYSEAYGYIYTTAGVHPECAAAVQADYIDQLEKLLQHPRAVAIGEIGLDYYWKEVPRDIQKVVFEKQLQLSKDLNLPVVIHDREAHGDTMDFLRKYKPAGLVHCFSGSVEMCREVVRLGLSISLGGVVTFKNARHSVEVAQDIPLDKLLLETDAPYLSPVPFRGKRCDSTMIRYTAQKIAEVRGMDVDQLIGICYDNACRLYRI